MKLYRTQGATLLERDGELLESTSFSIDDLFRNAAANDWIARFTESKSGLESVVAPLASQEVWAAGVTYYRSREARMEESEKEADVYDRVYSAERPELFFKATPHRVVGHGERVAIRADSEWNVPEAELALAIDRTGRGVRAVGWAPDQVIEAIEDASLRFWIGVQWHPEFAIDPGDSMIFAALIDAAG